MLTIQVAEVEELKNHLILLIHLSHYADFRFSRSSVSFTVSCPHNTSCLYAQLQLSEPFFTILTSTGPQEFHSCIQFDNFFIATSLAGADARLLTLLMPDDHSYTNLVYTNSIGHVRYCAALAMAPPLNMEVAPMDGGAFVAIDAEWFRDIAIRLSAFNTRIWVIATVSQVTFSAVLMEFVLPIEEKRCVVGGCSEFSNGVRFPVTLIPLQFFIHTSYLHKMVYFYRSTDGRTLVKFETGYWTSIVAYNPQDHWEVL